MQHFSKNFLAPTDWKTEKLKLSKNWNKVPDFIEGFPIIKNLWVSKPIQKTYPSSSTKVSLVTKIKKL